MEESNGARKRVRDYDDCLGDAAVKRLKEDLLDNSVDDYYAPTTAEDDLVSFMKRFEEEISGSVVAEDGGASAPDPREFSTNLGYLLKASDDDLGIPAAPEAVVVAEEEVGSATDSIPWELNPFEPDYGDTSSFWFLELDNGDGECVRCFEQSDLGLGSDECSFRPGSLWAE